MHSNSRRFKYFFQFIWMDARTNTSVSTLSFSLSLANNNWQIANHLLICNETRWLLLKDKTSSSSSYLSSYCSVCLHAFPLSFYFYSRIHNFNTECESFHVQPTYRFTINSHLTICLKKIKRRESQIQAMWPLSTSENENMAKWISLGRK